MKRNLLYRKERVEVYTDCNRKDLYVYSKFKSDRGHYRYTLHNQVDKYRGYSSGSDILDKLIKEYDMVGNSRFKLYQVGEKLEDFQVGSDCIYRDSDNIWKKDNLKKDFTYKNIYDGFKCQLLINPEKFNLHLEHEKFLKDRFMRVEPAIYTITLYDIISIVYNFRQNNVEVNKIHKVSRNIGRTGDDEEELFNRSFREDKISAIQFYYSIYEHYRQEAMPYIFEHLV